MEVFQYFYKLAFLSRNTLLFKNVKLSAISHSKWLKSSNKLAKMAALQHFNNMGTKGRYCFDMNNKTEISSGLFVSLIKRISKMTEDERFDIEKVTIVFGKSLHENDDVLLEDYLTAYEEINKFFQLMGSVFSFVSSDLRAKLDILITFRTNDPEHFTSIKTMILYEKESDLFKDKKYVSGSRTLLRLHRGLEFVYEFLLRIQGIDDSQKTVDCCKSAYNDTLSKHHPFLVRKGALLAMFALPTKGDLLNRVCVDVEQAKQTLPDMLSNARTVYDRTDSLYNVYDLHNLP